MRAANNYASAGQRAEARGDTRTLDAQSLPQHGAAGKAFAVWFNRIGARSLADTQAAFDRHPSWRGA